MTDAFVPLDCENCAVIDRAYSKKVCVCVLLCKRLLEWEPLAATFKALRNLESSGSDVSLKRQILPRPRYQVFLISIIFESCPGAWLH